MSIDVVYAIVRAGGRQEKVSVGDTIVINRVAGEAGDNVDLAPVLLVDGGKITSAQNDLAKVKVLRREGRGPSRREDPDPSADKEQDRSNTRLNQRNT